MLAACLAHVFRILHAVSSSPHYLAARLADRLAGVRRAKKRLITKSPESISWRPQPQIENFSEGVAVHWMLSYRRVVDEERVGLLGYWRSPTPSPSRHSFLGTYVT